MIVLKFLRVIRPSLLPNWYTPHHKDEPFPFSFLFFFMKMSVVPNFCFCGPFSLYERACHRRVSSANTAQQSSISPTQSSKASTCRPERDNASKEIELAIASMSSTIYTACYILKTNEEIEVRLAKIYNHSQGSWSWCDARRTRLYFQSQ